MDIGTIPQVICGLVLLFFGAEFLVKASSSLGLKLGITPLVVGLTIVGYGTSTPELIVSIQAAFQKQGDIVLGNVIGSNIANIGLILGLSSIIRPLHIKPSLNRFDMPVMIGSAVLLFLLSIGGRLSFWHGILFLIGLAAYTIWIIAMAKASSLKELEREEAAEIKELFKSKGLESAIVVISLAGLIYGAALFLDGSIALARFGGISEAVIGLTLVAIGTSLPELATSVVAAYRKHADVAIGNIVGSCIYNIIGILGISIILAPIAIHDISYRDFIVMILFSVYLSLLGLFKSCITRFHGFVLLFAYVVYISFLF